MAALGVPVFSAVCVTRLVALLPKACAASALPVTPTVPFDTPAPVPLSATW
ncbi:Uncharacterised protein [Mycobacterium tuberculosis]|nr:Uncharacterised protein [Mycobacterium tuberculosis]